MSGGRSASPSTRHRQAISESAELGTAAPRALDDVSSSPSRRQTSLKELIRSSSARITDNADVTSGTDVRGSVSSALPAGPRRPNSAQLCSSRDPSEVHRLATGVDGWREHLQALQTEYRQVLHAIDSRACERMSSLRCQLDRSRSYDMPPSYPPSEVDSAAVEKSSMGSLPEVVETDTEIEEVVMKDSPADQ